MSMDDLSADIERNLQCLHYSKTETLENATLTRARLSAAAQCLRLMAMSITEPDATCELLPGLAERLMRLHGKLLLWSDQAEGAAIVADSEREVVENLILAMSPKPAANNLPKGQGYDSETDVPW